MTLQELTRKYTNDQSKFIMVNGHNVHYRDEGEGEVLVLVHGTFASLHDFEDWTNIMKGSFRIIRLDLPGFGLTGPSPEDQYSLDRFVDFFEQFLESLNIERCSIAGNSLGGWMVWEYALKNQHRVDRMILINSAGYIKDRNYPLPFVIAQTPVLRNVFNYVPKAVVRRFVRQVFCNQSLVTDELVDKYFDLFHRDGNKEAFVKIANSHFVQNTDSLKELTIPVLIMWGEKDNWLNVDQSYKFERDIPNSKLIVYQNVGHVPMQEIPEETAKDALHFLLG